ncbi:carbohydrate binding domain-containing protein [Thioalkalivibrio sp. XN8]|uniref:carbohydrate binding domain-containing protein n=1 Tax=Thioalkalivibrio sp. XN8 TaxID=2712863 RepID=UPI0013EA11C1|nr:carbohydrate binding domain-containing protein [Thioalkalivibrio sp. XN8]NGP54433.1 hypothetical protein [Thioalkalivibrio sp. XN8]
MHATSSLRLGRLLTLLAVPLFLAGCLGEGDGPTRIPGTPAPPPPVIPPGFCDAINFEDLCGPVEFINFGGTATGAGGLAAIIDNPDASGINTSERVAQLQKFAGEVFAGSAIQLNETLDFAEGEAFTMKVWASRSVPLLFKLEDAVSGDPNLGKERTVNHSGSGSWEEFCVDFSGDVDGFSSDRITLIFDLGVEGDAADNPGDWTFYIDDIAQADDCGGGGTDPVNLPVDFELEPASYNFGADAGFGGGVATVIENPDQSGLNTTAQTARMQKFAGEVFGGSTLVLSDPIDFGAGEAFRMKVWAAREVPLLFKLEDAVSGDPALGKEATATHSGSGSWEEFCFDFSGEVAGFSSDSITFIFDLGIAGDAENNPTDWTFYFDEIEQVASCDGGGGADPGIVPDVVIFSSSAPPDLVFGVDYTGFEPFGSGSVFDNNVTTDPDFSPAFGVTTGDGYGAQVGQFAIVGFQAGFASSYETLDFKAKGLNNDLIRVRFLDDGEYLDIVLTGSAFSTPLGNDWYQVSIPLTSFTGVDTATALLFETDNTAPSAFTFLLTDFGFSGSRGPANSPNSIIPENVLFATDPNVPVDFVFGVDYTGFDPFGSGSVFNTSFADDPDFIPAISITSGTGYGANVAQFAIVGFAPGFAAGFGTLDFKIKGIPDDLVRVRFLDDGQYVDIDLATSDYSAPLGSDWYQVSIPLSLFTGVDTATALLFESNNTAPAQFTFLLTDIGFSGTADTGGELLVNGDFEADDADKAPWINAGVVVTNNYYTATANDGEPVFQTNLSQVVALTQGADYILTFRARANVARTMLAGIGLNVSPFTAATESVSLTTEWQTFSYTLSASADIGTAESRVLFDMGGVASTVDIDDVSLALASAPGVNLLVNGDFEASDADKAPWLNAGGIATNNYYTATANDGEPPFQTNLSQVVALTQGADYVLTFRARSDVDRTMLAGIGLNVSPFTAATETVALTTEWQTFSYTLNASADIGTAESRVLFDMGGVASTIDIDDVSLVLDDGGSGGGGGGGAGGELADNGGLEDGGLETGWTVFENGGSVSVVSDAFNGSFAAALVAGESQNPVLKQEEKGAGVVAQGDTINVTFAMKGSVGPGGVIFVEFFSENSGSVDAQFLGGGPIPPTADWTSYTFSPTVAGDAARGITLQFAAVCGPVAGCSAEITVDDVSMTIADGG